MQVDIKSSITTGISNSSGTLNVVQPESSVVTALTTNEQATGIQPKILDTDVYIQVPVTSESFIPSSAKLPISCTETLTPLTALTYTFTVPNITIGTPIVPLSIKIQCTSISGEDIVITESIDSLSAGTLISESPVFVKGQVDYTTGDISIELTENFDSSIDLVADYAYYTFVTLFLKTTTSPQYVNIKINYSELKNYLERVENQETVLINNMTGVL